ncbi:MAG: hydantoinase B/oxoprolinase family protein [Chloroflexi bacterium]|nr:hydantoinase B/oxoprolinase family protein [Chloroflexota bacterium]
MTGGSEVDPIIVAVLANRLDAITKEMGETMLRTSRSPIFAENRDFVTAIFDRHLRLVAQTAYIPVLLGASPHAMKAIARHFEGEVRPGDVFILNDPFSGNNHLPDISVARPVFCDGTLRFWAFTKGHHSDVGGGGAGGYNASAKSIFDEGLRIPPARLFRAGEYQSDIWGIILKNVRLPSLVEGDLHCQVGATAIGERALQALLEKYGPATLEQAMDEILLASHRQMKRELENIPQGTYYGERKMDHDGVGEMPTIRLKVIARGGEGIVFDFEGTDPQVPFFLNSSLPNTWSSCYAALYTSIDPDIKFNEGSLSLVSVRAPEGSIVNPREPAPTTNCTVLTTATIVEAIWLALAQAIPRQTQAAWSRIPTGIGAGTDPRTGMPFACIHLFAKGGSGATYGYDGWNNIAPVVSMGGSRIPDPELFEIVTPHFIVEYELLSGSAAPGRWRGGFGVSYKVRFEADDTRLAITGGGQYDETVPFGLAGGRSARRSTIALRRPDGSRIDFGAMASYYPSRGDVMEIASSGGGGYGDPLERDVDEVLKDVRDELISTEEAERDYGVVIDRLEVDVGKTLSRRSNK